MTKLVLKITNYVKQIKFYITLRTVRYVFTYGCYRTGLVRKKVILFILYVVIHHQYVQGFFVVSSTYATLYKSDISKATAYFLR
jgi:hypothetical protein